MNDSHDSSACRNDNGNVNHHCSDILDKLYLYVLLLNCIFEEGFKLSYIHIGYLYEPCNCTC